MYVVVLMPAYRAGSRVVDTFHKIPQGLVDKVIISDDASPDNTYALATALPATVLRNERNRGYGGNLKVCLREALKTKGDVFIEIHADGQYDPKFIVGALQALRPTDGMVLGSRLMPPHDARQAGMPTHKYIMNYVLTGIANMALGTHLTEFQSGFRLYTRSFLEKVDIQSNSDDHLFSLETILQALYHGFTVSEFPVICTYEPGVTQMRMSKGIKYTLEMLWALARYRLAKAGWPNAVFALPQTRNVQSKS